MRCSDFESRWNEILDRRESPGSDRQLQAHLVRCAVCRDRAAALDLAFVVIELASARESTGDFTERVLGDLAPAGNIRARNRRRFASSRWMIGAAAALLAAVALPKLMVSQPKPAAPAPPAIVSTVAAGTAELSPDAEKPGVALVPEPRPIPAPARESHGAPLALAMFTIPEVAVELAGSSTMERAAAGEAWANVSEGFRPVTASVSETWQILKRAIPALEPPQG